MRPLPSFWRSDKGLTALLVCLVALIFIGPAFTDTGPFGGFFVDLFFALVLVSGVSSLSHRKGATAGATALVVLAVLFRMATFLTPSKIVEGTSYVLAIGAAGLLAVLTLIQVFRDGPITAHRIMGAIAAYLLLGVTWSISYRFVDHLIPNAFQYANAPTHWLSNLYFSFVTLTTVGYGDVAPIAPAARSLAITEALVGQLYPAILIARLVSLEIADRASRAKK